MNIPVLFRILLEQRFAELTVSVRHTKSFPWSPWATEGTSPPFPYFRLDAPFRYFTGNSGSKGFSFADRNTNSNATLNRLIIPFGCNAGGSDLPRKKPNLVQKLKLIALTKGCTYPNAPKTDSPSVVRNFGDRYGDQPMSIAHSEAQLQAQIASYLSVALPVDARFHHSPSEGKRGWRSQAALKSSGFSAGWPDLEIIWQGRVYFLELKSEKGRVSPAQAECHAGLIAAGASVAIIRSLEEAVSQLRAWGVPLRASL